MRILISWVIIALSLAAAAYLIPGIRVTDTETLPGWATVAIMAIIVGLVNALIRPLLKVLTCPLIMLTLGLFTLVINAIMLLLAAWIGAQVGLGFEVDGFWPAFWGALVVSIVSFILSVVLGVRDDRRPQRRVEERRDRW